MTYNDKIRGKTSGINMIPSRLRNIITNNDKKKKKKKRIMIVLSNW